MARTPRTAAKPPLEVVPVEEAKKPGTALVNWEEQMAADAQAAADLEANSMGGGAFFSTRGGILSFQDTPLANNQMAVIILDYCLENIYFSDDFDPDSKQPPTCFAFGDHEDTISPHESVVEAGQAQHVRCKGCDKNEWGTAPRGNGKACRNTRRMACVAAGEFDEHGRFKAYDLETVSKHPVGLLKPPVTSVKGWAKYVHESGKVLHRPPYGLITKVRLTPHVTNQYSMLFETVGLVPNDLMPMVIERREVVRQALLNPYNLTRDDEGAQSRGGKAATPRRAQPAARATSQRATGRKKY